MLTQEDLKAIADLMDAKIEPIYKRLDKIEEDIAMVKEDTEITRVATNQIIEWIDENFQNEYPFPVKDKQAV